jgi:putative membrane protein
VASRIESYFSESDRNAIREATSAAEAETSGELVVFVTERCGAYRETGWKAAVIGAALGALAAAISVQFFGGWGKPDSAWILAALELGFLLGGLLSLVDPVRRWLAGEELLTRHAEGRATLAFIEEEVFATKDRTGILLFLALFEHRVVVLADTGIHDQVADAIWHAISDDLARGIRSGAPTSALIRAIEQCATLLVEHGVTAAEDDKNELSNEPRFRHE